MTSSSKEENFHKNKNSTPRLNIVDWGQNKKGTLTLPPEVFSKPLNKPLLHSAIIYSLAKKRKGTHKAKTKGEVSGGGIKPYRQKGTGNARRGSNRSPLISGGGVIFPPKPKSYAFTLSKKTRKEALKITLSYLYQSKQILVLNEMKLKTGKTKELLNKLKTLKIKKGILLSSSENALLKRASNNLKNFQFKNPSEINIYDLLKFKTLISDQKSLEKLTEKALFQTLKLPKTPPKEQKS